jgi:hypothetical protein
MKTVKAYKVFDPDWKYRGFQYETGKTYSIKEEPSMCERGFHACQKVSDCFTYYSFDPKNKVAEVILSGIILGLDSDKQCAQKITIVREVTWEEMLTLANSGIGNSGYRNSGDGNSGNRNSGYRNSGDGNSGDGNSGDGNSGYGNSGDRNSGYRNSGNGNSGNRNSGYRNSGYRNSGDGNSGDGNSGDGNSGYGNSGYRNSGNGNSGNGNSGDGNSGNFNSITPNTILVFNKECEREVWDNAPKPNFIYNINIDTWVSWSNMTDDEKKSNKDAFVTDGYLKTVSYKEAWAIAYKDASKEDIKLLKALPNFDANVFEEITGIKIN